MEYSAKDYNIHKGEPFERLNDPLSSALENGEWRRSVEILKAYLDEYLRFELDFSVEQLVDIIDYILANAKNLRVEDYSDVYEILTTLEKKDSNWRNVNKKNVTVKIQNMRLSIEIYVKIDLI